MYGSDIGQLSVIVQGIGGVGGTREHLKWRLRGNQGNMWRKASVPIGTAAHTGSYYRVSIIDYCFLYTAITRFASSCYDISLTLYCPIIEVVF